MSTDQNSTESSPAATQPRRAVFGWSRWLIGTLSVIVLPAALIGAVAWTLGTDEGMAWALAQQRYVEVEHLRGNALGGFSAQRIIVRWGPALENHVVIDAPRASPLGLAAGGAHSWLRIHAAQVSADRVSVRVAPSGAAPTLPDHLHLPVEIEVDAAHVGALELPGLEAHLIRNASGRVHLGAEEGTTHRADAVRFAVGPLQWSGTAQIGSDSGLPLRVKLQAGQATDAQAPRVELPPWARAVRQDWRARLDAQGPLARFAATLQLRAQGQRLDAQAEVAPLETWPLPRLDARTERLDLSALLSHAPITALSGEVHIAPVPGQAGTLSARASLVNERPGRWDRQALPVRALAFDVRAQDGALRRFEFVNVRAVLADESRDAGQVQGSVDWNAGAFSAKAALLKVQPNLLDPRLAAMTLSGPLSLSGVISPVPRVDMQAELTGHLDKQGGGNVEFRVDAAASALHVEVRELLAKAGGAQLMLSGTARRSLETSPWQFDAKTKLTDFDPLPWFPGEPESAWRRGPHRFTGDAQFAFTLPTAAQPPSSIGDWLEWLPTLQGEARLTLHPSQLAGVALRGEAGLKAVSSTRSSLTARLDVAGNTATAQGEWALGDAGRSDRWDIDVSAPQLARLAPLRSLVDVPISWAAPRGAFEASLRLQGRWPQLRAEGSMKTDGLRIAEASVTRGQASWSFGPATDSPFELSLDLTDARWNQQQAHSVTLNLLGTSRAHTLELRTALNVAAPAMAEIILGNRPADDSSRAATLVHLEARGGMRSEPDDAAPMRWQGSVQDFDVRSNAQNAAPLLLLRNLALELNLGDSRTARSIEIEPGRGQFLGTTLRWDRAFWKAASPEGPAQFDAEAELGPIAVAPLLARVQPHLGWRGDLVVGGHVHVRSTPSFNADVVLERTQGDLSVSDETGTQALQLTDLRLALIAQDGVWSITQALAGKTLGEAAGAVTARVTPPQLWPSADTPIQGVLEARVANLGTWGTWVPPGWRLAGSLRTSAAIGGRLGAPEYTGEIRGNGIGVRNIVQGVNVIDGEVDIKLQGLSARIERFEAKAGGGTLRLEGDATLGEQPRAELQLSVDKFQLLGRVDRRIVTSGSAKLELNAQSVNLQGRLNVDEGLIDFTRGDAPSLADDVRVAARSGAAEPSVEPPRGPSRSVAMDLQVGLGERLRLRGRGLDTQLRGELRLTTPAAKLAVDGTVRTAAGTYAAYGQKLSIDRGELTFTGAVENPRLDIIATRPNLEQVVGVAVTGTALNPRVRLFSEPEMADLDKLSWLVLGRAQDSLGGTDTALLQRAALGLLAGEGSGPTDQLINAVGLDEVSFRQTEGEVRETVVSLGKQLSKRWYVGYERSLNATTGNWQLIYRIAQRLTLRAQSGLDNSLDAIWTWRWQ